MVRWRILSVFVTLMNGPPIASPVICQSPRMVVAWPLLLVEMSAFRSVVMTIPSFSPFMFSAITLSLILIMFSVVLYMPSTV